MQGRTFETCIWGVSAFLMLLLFTGQNAGAAVGEVFLNQAKNPEFSSGFKECDNRMALFPHLRPAVHMPRLTVNVTAVIGCEKSNGRCDVVGVA